MKGKSIKTLALSFLLVAICAISSFALVGCGETSLSTLAESYEAMQTKVESMQDSGIFNYASNGSYETNYYLDYGTTVNAYVTEGLYSKYTELASIFNSMLATANEYTDANTSNILGLTSSDLTSSVKSAITKLNSSIITYTKYLSTFITARNTLISHFEISDGSNPQGGNDLVALNSFKKTYAVLVADAVDLANCTANVIEKVGIIDLLSTADLTAESFEDFQGYASAKVLQVFSDLIMTEVESKLTWESTTGDDKARITSLISDYETQYQVFLNSFATASSSIDFSSTSQDSLHALMDSAISALEEFEVEIEDFQTSLSGFNIYKFAITYENNLTSYLSSNEYAEIYLEKMEQFVTYSLPNFTDFMTTTLSLSA